MSDTTIPAVIVVDNGDATIVVDIVDQPATIDVTAPASTETIDVIVSGGGGGGSIEGAVISSPAGDGPRPETMAVYTGNGFAGLTTKDANTYYVVTPPSGGSGSLYLGNTLLVGSLLAAPGMVPSVTATAGDTQITVNWGVPSTGGLLLSGYIVERSSGLSGYATVGTTSGSVRTFVDTGLTNGTTYSYRVIATNAMGNGPSSVPASAIPVTTSATVLVSSDTSVDAGSAVTFTATVTSGGSPVTNGGVTFRRNGNIMTAGVPVSGAGVAAFTTSSLPIGSWSITAQFDGGVSWLPSDSNTVTQVMTFAGGAAPTTVLLVSNDASSVPGQPVTFTVTVTVTATGIAATSGTVVFRDAGAALTGALPVNSLGAAAFTTSLLSEATHSMTATYSGAPFYEDATSNTVSQVVAPGTGAAGIAQTLLLSKPVAVVGEVVSFRTTVMSGSTQVTSGTVVWKDGATVLGDGTPLNLFGESMYITYDLPVGTHSITAVYTGAPIYENDTSSPLDLTVVASIAAPSPNDWQTAFDSNSLPQITAWYDYNTGHLTEGFTNADLWNPAGVGSNAQVDITASWLTDNEGANVVETSPDHWTVTGLHATGISIQVSHITLEHCWIERRDYATVWGHFVEVWDPASTAGDKSDDVTLGDFEINHCTFSSDGTGGEDTFGDAIKFDPLTPTANDLTFNYCEVTMVTAGFKANMGMTVNYCWAHDLNLFGFEPHNTSGSIRGRQCRFNRNLMTDGTSSDVSMYSDLYPHTDFWVTENTFWINHAHAVYEVLFPERGTGFSELEPGFTREFTGNKMLDGLASDLQWFTKVAGNTLITGVPLFGGAAITPIPEVPTTLALATSAQYFNNINVLPSYHFTPTHSSTLLCFFALGRANSGRNPDITFSDDSGALWSLVPGTDTPLENAPGDTANYALCGSLWTHQTSAAVSQPFRSVTIDPYATFTTNAYMAALYIEITDVTGLTLVQPPALSARGHAVPFTPGIIGSMASGTLASPATSGNYTMLFIATSHGPDDGITAPSGWNVLGNSTTDDPTGATCLWRTDFTGTSVTVPDLGAAGTCVMVLCEFSA